MKNKKAAVVDEDLDDLLNDISNDKTSGSNGTGQISQFKYEIPTSSKSGGS